MTKVARLLEKIAPERYQLELDVDMAGFRYEGKEAVEFELREAGRELVFHAVGLEVTKAELDGGTAAAEIRPGQDGHTVTFAFEQMVEAGKHTLRLEFGGAIQESLHGFYRSKYTHDGRDKWLVTTQFEAVHAREAFVCIDEPAAKAVFELSLVVPKGLEALANTNVTQEEKVGAERKRVMYAPTPRMSTYLVAFAIGEFEYVEREAPSGVAVRMYATPGQKHQLEFALETSIRTLEFYNDYFGVPYPLPKLDMLAIPDFAAGAMENWGLITYRETALLLDPVHTSLINKQRVAEVVAHELAHQWFGNLVTMAWWDDLWLNEGFATWVASLAMDKLFPEWEIWTSFVDQEYAYALDTNGLANAPALQVDITDPAEMDSVFDPGVVYAKGASVIRMLDAYVGREAFQAGLQTYLKRHSYGNSVTHDLWRALGEASQKPVDAVMSAWIAKAGYPLLAYDQGEVRQRRFYASPREAAKVKGGKGEHWPVPFSARLASGETTEPILLEAAAAQLPAEVTGADWFKPNPGQTALYRSLYTEPMVQALTQPLRDGALGPIDRFGVVNDTVAGIEAGVLDSTVGLKLVEGLREEVDYLVWNAVSGGLGAVRSVVEDEDLRQRLGAFGRWLVQPNVKRLGWTPREGEPVFDTLMRPLVLSQALRFDDEAVTAEARKRFQTWADGGEVDPDLRPAILYAAARHGGRSEFDTMLDRYRNERVPQIKMSLLGAMGRFRDPAVISRYLEVALSDDVRPQDLYIVLAWSFRNREARMQAWEWMKQHWDLWLQRYGAGGHMLDRFPLSAASGFATHEMAEQIREFFESHPHPALTRATAQAVESVELKADWGERDHDKIARFIQEWESRQK